MTWFAEQMMPTGRWTPVKFTEEPPTKMKDGHVHLLRADGVGPMLRAKAVKVHPDHAHLSPGQLREVYAPDGKFRATAPRPDIEDDGFITVHPTTAAHSAPA